VEDLYTLYVLVYGIDPEMFWDFPIASVERVFQDKQAYDGWQANPR
jgi:hypothetical protein